MAARKNQKGSPKTSRRTPPQSAVAKAGADKTADVSDAARVRPRTVSIGRFNAAATHLARNLSVPILPDATDAMFWAPDLLEQAFAERKIVALVGVQGTGKSVAMDRAVARHETAELTKRHLDERYDTLRTVKVLCPRVADARTLLIAIYRAAFDAPPLERAKGTRKSVEDLLDEMVVRLLDESVGVLIIDEAELLLNEEGWPLLRDISSKSELAAPLRYTRAGDKLAAGVGILLVGTYDVEIALASLKEDGQRVTRVQRVVPLDWKEVPTVYTRLLPAFAAGARQMGKREWSRFIATEVSHRLAVPVRFLENHTRLYVRRMAEDNPKIESADAIPFDAAQFTYTLAELRRPSMMGGSAVGPSNDDTSEDHDDSDHDQDSELEEDAIDDQEHAA
jgi:hypothetical protein